MTRFKKEIWSNKAQKYLNRIIKKKGKKVSFKNEKKKLIFELK